MKIFNPLINKLLLSFILSFCFGQKLETAFVKYYLNDRDFLSDNPILASDRRDQAYLEVTFNEKKQPVLKKWLNQSHQLVKEEMFVYDKSNALTERLFLNKNRKTDKMIYYGKKEPWGVEFRKYALPNNQTVSFTGQQTEFVLNGSDEIHQIIFRTVNSHDYGSIQLSYDHLGFLQEEVWRNLPDGEIIRKFVYHYDVINQIQQIWEFGRDNREISHVALSMAPADELYTTPPPRTGNVLDEADIIYKELVSKSMIAPIPAFIPYTEWDRLKMNNDEEMDIIIISLEDNLLRFSLPTESDVLSISLDRVSSITSKYGKRIYP